MELSLIKSFLPEFILDYFTIIDFKQLLARYRHLLAKDSKSGQKINSK